MDRLMVTYTGFVKTVLF